MEVVENEGKPYTGLVSRRILAYRQAGAEGAMDTLRIVFDLFIGFTAYLRSFAYPQRHVFASFFSLETQTPASH